jgi:hypothetical protein
VEIDGNNAASGRDTFRWRDNLLNGGNVTAMDWDATSVVIPASGGPYGPFDIPGGGGLSYGFTISFGSPGGTWADGNVGDRWSFTAYPATGSTVVKTLTGGQGIAVGGTGDARTVNLVDCAPNEVLKRNAGDTDWVCATDAAGGGGTVTSVGLAMPAGVFSVSGSPVTASGTLTAAFQTQTANRVFAGPASGGDAAPAFRLLGDDDIPDTLTAGNYVLKAGDTMTGNLAIQKADGGVLLDNATAGGTDFWVAVNDDADAVDDDLFQVGDGLTIGTNPFLTINTSGNVGIGTPTPSANAKLHVAGGAAAVDADQKLSLEGAAASGDSYLVFDSANNRIRFYLNGFEVARLKE